MIKTKENIMTDDFINNYHKYDEKLINFFITNYIEKISQFNNKNVNYKKYFIPVELEKKFFNFNANNIDNLDNCETIVIGDFQLMTGVMSYVNLLKKYKNIKNILYFDDKDPNSINPYFKKILNNKDITPGEALMKVIKIVGKTKGINFNDINIYKSTLESSNTKENTLSIQQGLKENNLGNKFIYPTKGFHGLRSYLSIKKVANNLEPIIYPVDIYLHGKKVDYNYFNDLKKNILFSNKKNEIYDFLIGEMVRILKYGDKGDLEDYQKIK